MTTLGVRLPDEMFQRLSKIAEKTKRTKSSIIKEMLEESIDYYEGAYTSTNPRAGWKKQILKEIKKNGYPEMLIPDNISNKFDEDEWEW